MLVADEQHEIDTVWEDEFDEIAETYIEPELTIWEKIRRVLFGEADTGKSYTVSDNHRRMTELTQAIEAYPEAAVNYLLRAELHLKLKQNELAQEDFEQALTLAQAQYQSDRWGLASQVVQDRALRGLKRIAR